MTEQFGLVYWSTLDPTVRQAQGTYRQGYTLFFNGQEDSAYFLNMTSDRDQLFPPPTTPSRVLYPFYMVKPPLHNWRFWNYWTLKGVCQTSSGRNWQHEMWKIINGQEPTFYLYFKGKALFLVDGLKKWLWGNGLGSSADLMDPINPWTLAGDYPLGQYTFTGKIENRTIGTKISIMKEIVKNPSNLFLIQNASKAQGKMDSALTALLSSMAKRKLYFYKTFRTPSGIIGANDVIILKVNAQSEQRGHTNTDLVKSIIKSIVAHPEGFSGEVVIADNGWGGLNMTENNAYDHSQSMATVAGMFPNFKVSTRSWLDFDSVAVNEFDAGDTNEGFIVDQSPDPDTGINVSYPKFQTSFGTKISLKKGIWNEATHTYQSAKLKVINLPILKSHYDYGVTACVKNYMGVGSHGLTDEHLAVADGGMGTQMIKTRFPSLNILDCIYINANPLQPGQSRTSPGVICGPFTAYDEASYTDTIGACIDPVALEYWAAKNVAIPAAIQNGNSYTSSIDPDYVDITPNLAESYHTYLNLSLNQISKSGRPATMQANRMRAYITDLKSLPFSDDFTDLDDWNIVDGSWTLISGGVEGSETYEALIYAGSQSWTNYTVETSLCPLHSPEASLVVRLRGPKDFYWLGLGCWGHKYSISKVVGGNYQEIAGTGLSSQISPGVWYSIKAVAMNDLIQLFVDGNKVLEVHDSSLPSGFVGIRTYGNTIQTKQFIVQ